MWKNHLAKMLIFERFGLEKNLNHIKAHICGQCHFVKEE